VRQAAAVSLALVMMQQPNSHAKASWARDRIRAMVHDKHEDVLAKFGAIFAQGIIDAGGHNVTVSMCRDHGHMDVPTVVGLLLFSQFWSWFPMCHFLSLALRPTTVICLNADLKMPKIQLLSACKPSRFAPPPATEPPKEKEKEKVAVAVLSITSKAAAHKKKKGAAEGGAAAGDMEGVKEAGAEAEKAAEEETSAAPAKPEPEPEPESYLLPNPARVVPAQVPCRSGVMPLANPPVPCAVHGDICNDSPTVSFAVNLPSPLIAVWLATDVISPPPRSCRWYHWSLGAGTGPCRQGHFPAALL